MLLLKATSSPKSTTAHRATGKVSLPSSGLSNKPSARSISRAALQSSPEIRHISSPNAVHQADLLFLLHDKLPRTHCCRSRHPQQREPLTSKDSAEDAKAFQSINKRSPQNWPRLLQVDPGREFMGSVTKEMENHKALIRRGRTEIQRDQAIVERFNRPPVCRGNAPEFGTAVYGLGQKAPCHC